MIIAVDIGGTKIAVARVAESEVLESREVQTPRPAVPQAVVDTVMEQIRGWVPDASGVGIATAGGVQEGRVTAVSRVILPEWTDVPLAEIVSDQTDLPVWVVNDGQAAAWGEHRRGAGRDRKDLLFVTVSTGVGGGIVAGGSLAIGRAGRAGHVGHLTVDPNGPWCSCGRRGCLEQLVSGTAMAKQAQEAVERTMTAKEVFEWAQRGEPWAEGIVRASARYLARGLSSLQHVLDPGLVVLGGGVGLAEGYIQAVREELEAIPLGGELKLERAELGRHAALIGVADLASRDLAR